ncbi:MAG: hypothetical protein ABI432_19445 [Flavobacteriales bacterium]
MPTLTSFGSLGADDPSAEVEQRSVPADNSRVLITSKPDGTGTIWNSFAMFSGIVVVGSTSPPQTSPLAFMITSSQGKPQSGMKVVSPL